MSGLAKRFIVAFDTASLATVRIMLAAVPRDVARLAGAVFGAMGLVVSPERRRRALENLRKIFPNMSTKERKRIRRKCFVQFGAGFAEVFHLHRKKHSYLRGMVDIEGMDNLEAALSEGRGVLAVGCHLSNFPFGMLALAARGLPVAALVREADNPAVENMVNDIRRNFDLEWIYVKPRQEAARRCMAWLRKGNVLWVLVDQRNRDGIVVDFLGHKSQVAPGAALFARRTACPALPIVTVRMDNSRYRVIIGERIPVVSSDDRDADVHANMERFLDVVGRRIVEHPQQWTWFHKMWKVREEALAK
jgi:KDO2-lipid IV(A) lauroyltransferase